MYVETPRIGMRMEKSDNGMRGVMTFWEKRESVGGTTTGDKSRIVIYRVTAGFLLFRVRGRRVSSSSLRARARIKLPPRPVRRRRDERDGTVATKTCPSLAVPRTSARQTKIFCRRSIGRPQRFHRNGCKTNISRLTRRYTFLYVFFFLRF